MSSQRYVKASGMEAAMNAGVAWLTRLGISLYGARILAVRGRSRGAWRTVPVNVLEHAGRRYLVAPRGTTQWVRNLRAAGGGELRLGRRCEAFRAVEIGDAEKPPLLRAYLAKWRFEVDRFFAGIGPDATDEALLRIAPDYPVFRIEP